MDRDNDITRIVNRLEGIKAARDMQECFEDDAAAFAFWEKAERDLREDAKALLS